MRKSSQKLSDRLVTPMVLSALAAATVGCGPREIEEEIDCDNPWSVVEEVRSQAFGTLPCVAGVLAQGFKQTKIITEDADYGPLDVLAVCATKEDLADVLQCDDTSVDESPCNIVREALNAKLSPDNDPKIFLATSNECLSDGQYVCSFGATYGQIAGNVVGFDEGGLSYVDNDTIAYYCKENNYNVLETANDVW